MATHDARWLDLARRGDHEAFAQLVEPHRRAVHVHCYHMLGSLADADDVVQETLLRAWRGIRSFGGRSSFRTWLYTIATNASLSALATRKRRRRAVPQELGPPSNGTFPSEPAEEIAWLEPYPDAALERVADTSPTPEELHETREAVGLAFVAAVQHAAAAARRLAVVRRAAVLAIGGRRDARHDGRIGEQRAATFARNAQGAQRGRRGTPSTLRLRSRSAPRSSAVQIEHGRGATRGVPRRDDVSARRLQGRLRQTASST